jgi:hypothetical protein
MPRLLALVIAASIFGTSTAAFAAPALEHVRGTIKSISDTVLVVHTTSGTDETVNLTGTTGYLTVAKSNLDHIDPGATSGSPRSRSASSLWRLEYCFFLQR